MLPRPHSGSARPGTTIAHIALDPKRSARLAKKYPGSVPVPEPLALKANTVYIARFARNIGVGLASGGTAVDSPSFVGAGRGGIASAAGHAAVIGLAVHAGNLVVRCAHAGFDRELQSSEFVESLRGTTPFAVLKGNRLVATPTCPRRGGRERVLIDRGLADAQQLMNYNARRKRNNQLIRRLSGHSKR